MVGPDGEPRPSRNVTVAERAADHPVAHERRLRPVHRTLLTIVTGLLCGMLLLGTGIALASGPKADIHDLRAHVNVVQNALNEVHASLAKSSDEIRQSLAAADPLAAERADRGGGHHEPTRVHRTQDLPGRDHRPPRRGQRSSSRFQTAQRARRRETIDRFSTPTADPATTIATEGQLARDNQELLGSVREAPRPLRRARRRAPAAARRTGFDGIAVRMLLVFGLLSLVWVPIIYITMRGANDEEHDLRTALLLRQESNRTADLDNQVAAGARDGDDRRARVRRRHPRHAASCCASARARRVPRRGI